MKDKKKIAAVTAVLACLKEEEDVVAGIEMQRARTQRDLNKGLQPQMNIWGVTGRQAQMQFRNLMQAKAFHGLNIRN